MQTKKILIADDDSEHLIMLAFILRKAGYQVVSAFDAKHAIQMAVEQAPDLLILDIHMGDAGGFDVQERLQKISELADTPVIYLTGDKSNWVKDISASLGSNAVIGKPFETDHLLRVVKTAIESREGTASERAGAWRMSIPACNSAETYLG